MIDQRNYICHIYFPIFIHIALLPFLQGDIRIRDAVGRYGDTCAAVEGAVAALGLEGVGAGGDIGNGVFAIGAGGCIGDLGAVLIQLHGGAGNGLAAAVIHRTADGGAGLHGNGANLYIARAGGIGNLHAAGAVNGLSAAGDKVLLFKCRGICSGCRSSGEFSNNGHNRCLLGNAVVVAAANAYIALGRIVIGGVIGAPPGFALALYLTESAIQGLLPWSPACHLLAPQS